MQIVPRPKGFLLNKKCFFHVPDIVSYFYHFLRVLWCQRHWSSVALYADESLLIIWSRRGVILRRRRISRMEESTKHDSVILHPTKKNILSRSSTDNSRTFACWTSSLGRQRFLKPNKTDPRPRGKGCESRCTATRTEGVVRCKWSRQPSKDPRLRHVEHANGTIKDNTQMCCLYTYKYMIKHQTRTYNMITYIQYHFDNVYRL